MIRIFFLIRNFVIRNHVHQEYNALGILLFLELCYLGISLLGTLLLAIFARYNLCPDTICAPIQFVPRYNLLQDTICARYSLCPIQFVSDTNCADTNCADTICADTICTFVHVQIVSAQIVSAQFVSAQIVSAQIVSGTYCIGNKLYREQTVSGKYCIGNILYRQVQVSKELAARLQQGEVLTLSPQVPFYSTYIVFLISLFFLLPSYLLYSTYVWMPIRIRIRISMLNSNWLQNDADHV